MRFESKEFILSRRQSQESQEVKKSDHPKIKPVSERTQEYLRRTNSKTPSTVRKNSPKEEKKISENHDDNDTRDENHDDNDARDDSASDKEEPSEPVPNDKPKPVDFSKKELQQLAKLRLQRKQELVLAEKQRNEKFRNRQNAYNPVDEFLKAREAVRQANKEKGIESSQVIDDLIRYFLPSHMWMGKLMSESKGAIDKVQDRMLAEYNHEY